MLIVTGYVHVEPPDVAEFATDIQVLAHSAKQRDGGTFYAVAVDDRAAGRLLVVERWRGRMRGDLPKYDAANERTLFDE